MMSDERDHRAVPIPSFCTTAYQIRDLERCKHKLVIDSRVATVYNLQSQRKTPAKVLRPNAIAKIIGKLFTAGASSLPDSSVNHFMILVYDKNKIKKSRKANCHSKF